MTQHAFPGVHFTSIMNFEDQQRTAVDSPRALIVCESPDNSFRYCHTPGTAVAQWLTCCATNRKVAGSIPTGVSGCFIDIKSFRLHYGPGVYSAFNRNEYQEHFLGVKAADA